MHVRIEIFVPMLAVMLQFAESVEMTDHEEMEVHVQSMDVKPLKCYRCYEYEDHCMSFDNITNIEIKECARDEQFCQIRRHEKRDVLQSFERSCARECMPGCRTVLFRTLCIKCCNSTLCNSDSAPGGPAASWHVFLAAGFVMTLMYIQD